MKKWHIATLAIVLSTVLSSAYANATPTAKDAPYNVIFARPYLGGIACEALRGKSDDEFAATPKKVYTQPQLSKEYATSKMLQPVYAGDGESVCIVLFSEIHPLSNNDNPNSDALFKVFTEANEAVWIQAKQAETESITTIAAFGSGEVIFREAAPTIFLDKTLTKTIATNDLFSEPKKLREEAESFYKKHTTRSLTEQELNEGAVNFGVYPHIKAHKEPITINNESYTRLSLSFKVFTSSEDANNYREFFIRDVYIKSFDQDGKINLWASSQLY